MSSSFSLLESAWIPVRRQSGARCLLRPAALTQACATDPVCGLDWPRPDFDAAAREFLIGLLSTACWQEAKDSDAWMEWWHKPPSPEELEDRLAPFAQAFVLDGPGPRFCQDFSVLEGEETGVAALLMDEPGERDLFVKRGRVTRLGRPAAAMALFTLQAFAPSGGKGHRTSLRGGGPMSTLLAPRPAPTLWHLLWLNASWDADWDDPLPAEHPRIFPWLAPTRVSDGGTITTPCDVHPAQCFWGMPRRIRLAFQPNPAAAPCDLTGDVDTVVVERYQTRPYGTNYEKWGKIHPLTPYYRKKPTDAEWFPVHPQPGRMGYRDWVGLVVSDADSADKECSLPAAAIFQGYERLKAVKVRRSLLLACGFDMANMKARGFLETNIAISIISESVEGYYHSGIRSLVYGAREAASLLSHAIGQALSGGEMPDSSKGDRLLARGRFWERTEDGFLQMVEKTHNQLETWAGLGVAPDDQKITAEITQKWRDHLRDAVLTLFDQLVPSDAIEERAMKRLVETRRDLVAALNGHGKGAAFFTALGLPLPEKATTEKTAGRQSKTSGRQSRKAQP